MNITELNFFYPRKKGGVKIVPFSTGTIAEIRAMLNAEKAGLINTANYWNVGDTRTVRHSAITGNSFHNAPEQDVTWRLSQKGGKVDANNSPILWQVDMSVVLGDSLGAMLETSEIMKWSTCALRTWSNGAFKNSLPADFASLFVSTKMQQFDGTDIETTYDYFAPRNTGEIGIGSGVIAAESAVTPQISYYSTQGNSIKKGIWDGTAHWYWLRSNYSNAAWAWVVRSQGDIEQQIQATSDDAYYSFFGCIA